MRKIKIPVLLACAVALMLAVSCGQNKITVEDNAENITAESVTAENTTAESVTSEEEDYVDLTTLSGTMVYAEVYNMMLYPESYVGKTVKMDGMYTFFHDDRKNKDYHACIIMDATACCAQGIEFELKEGFTYPDNPTETNIPICVVGKFDTYHEEGYTYCVLRDAELTRKNKENE